MPQQCSSMLRQQIQISKISPWAGTACLLISVARMSPISAYKVSCKLTSMGQGCVSVPKGIHLLLKKAHVTLCQWNCHVSFDE